jgi:hypothetical protein
MGFLRDSRVAIARLTARSAVKNTMNTGRTSPSIRETLGRTPRRIRGGGFAPLLLRGNRDDDALRSADAPGAQAPRIVKV